MWERNIDPLPPVYSLTGDRTCNPGMCADWEWNLQPFSVQDDSQPINWATRPGLPYIFSRRRPQLLSRKSAASPGLRRPAPPAPPAPAAPPLLTGLLLCIHLGLEQHPKPRHLLTLELIQLGSHMVADKVQLSAQLPALAREWGDTRQDGGWEGGMLSSLVLSLCSLEPSASFLMPLRAPQSPWNKVLGLQLGIRGPVHLCSPISYHSSNHTPVPATLTGCKTPKLSPGWCGSVDWAPACEPKGR